MTIAKRLMATALLTGAAMSAASMAAAAGVTVGNGATAVQGRCTQEVTVAITATAVTAMDAFGLDLTFNTANLTYVRTEAGTATADWGALGGNVISSGVVRVGAAKLSGTALTGNGVVANIVFQCSGGCGAGSNVTASNLVDDLSGATVTNGSVTCSATGSGPVTKVKEYTFDANAEGWSFQQYAPTFNAPISDLATPGYLLVASNDNNTLTYGDVVSPLAGFTMDAFTPATGENPLAPLYLVRFYVRRTSADATKAPTYRLRVNSTNFEDYHILTANSIADLGGIPKIFTSTALDLLFSPQRHMYDLAAGNRQYTIAFDLINVPATGGDNNDVNGGYILDKVEVYAIPDGKINKVNDAKTYAFASAGEFSDWENFNYASFEPVVFGSTAGTGLTMHAANPNPDPNPLSTSGYGNWQTKANMVVPNATGATGSIYVRSTFTVGSLEASGHKVPQMRFRTAPSSFSTIAEAGVLDTGSFTFVPTSGNDRVYHTYLKVPAAASFPVIEAWDLLSFESFSSAGQATTDETSTQNVILRNLDVDVITITDYPAAN